MLIYAVPQVKSNAVFLLPEVKQENVKCCCS